MQPIKALAVAKAIKAKAISTARAQVGPTTTKQDGGEAETHYLDFTVRVHGAITIDPDTTQAPTCRIPLLATLALACERMGFQREGLRDILVEAMTSAIEMQQAPSGVLADYIREAEEAESFVRKAVEELPRVPRKGAVRAALTVTEEEATQ